MPSYMLDTNFSYFEDSTTYTNNKHFALHTFLCHSGGGKI